MKPLADQQQTFLYETEFQKIGEKIAREYSKGKKEGETCGGRGEERRVNFPLALPCNF